MAHRLRGYGACRHFENIIQDEAEKTAARIRPASVASAVSDAVRDHPASLHSTFPTLGGIDGVGPRFLVVEPTQTPAIRCPCGWEAVPYGLIPLASEPPLTPDDMDSEHAILFGKLLVLRACTERELIDVELDGVMRFANQHFAHEETLMEALSDADRERHIQAHESIAIRLAELKIANLRTGALRAELIDTIETWLTDHITTYDAVLRVHLPVTE